MHPMMNIAERAARRAGDVIIRGYEQRHRLNIEQKSAHDYVSEVDRQAEQVIVKTLSEAFPDHAILAEEGSGQAGDSKYRWIIDPLDGTTNFLHGHPQFAVSIAFLENNLFDYL
jgi:myo-inositol-1(or 4)-monophosphatase